MFGRLFRRLGGNRNVPVPDTAAAPRGQFNRTPLTNEQKDK